MDSNNNRNTLFKRIPPEHIMPSLLFLVVEGVFTTAAIRGEQHVQIVSVVAMALVAIFFVWCFFPARILTKEIEANESLRDSIDDLFKNAGDRSNFKGYLINSGRFFEKFSEYEKQGLRLGSVMLLMPSKEAIELAYKNKPESKKEYLLQTITAYKAHWEGLAKNSLIKDIQVRYVNAFPSSLYLIRNDSAFVTGLYEPNPDHVIGFSSPYSWMGNDEEDVKAYVEWFEALWNDTPENHE